jgi:hypothetical protein
MAEKLDHGVVNLPLDKRGGGSLDAQIDRFKAGQQRDAKAQAKDKHARSVEAKEFVDHMDDAQLRRLAEKAGMTVVQARKKLLSMARFEPDKVLRLKAAQPTEETMRSLIRRLEEGAVWQKDSAGKYERLPPGEARADDIRSRLRVMSDKAASQKARDNFDRLMRGMAKKPAARKHAFIDNIERVFDSFLGDKGFRADKDAVARSKAADNGSDAMVDMKTGEHMSQKQIDQRDARAKQAAKEREADAEKRQETERKKELMAGGGHVGGKKIFSGEKASLDKLKAGGPVRKGVDAGGEGTMPGPEGEVEGKWVTVRGKRMFFPNDPGEGVPEGPWGGAPWRPGWDGKGGDWRKGRGVPKQKGQMSLFGKNEDMQSLFQRLEEEAGRSKEIADEILRQLGGRRFLVMTGARNLLAFDTLDAERKWPGLQVQFPHGNAKVMRIALAPDDTYVIQFMTRAGRVTKEMDDIYSEVLQRVVSDYTGLALSL